MRSMVVVHRKPFRFNVVRRKVMHQCCTGLLFAPLALLGFALDHHLALLDFTPLVIILFELIAVLPSLVPGPSLVFLRRLRG